jgi:hypothetical protein
VIRDESLGMHPTVALVRLLLQSGKKLLRIPALQALVTQCIALVVVLLSASVIFSTVSQYTDVNNRLLLFTLVIMQSLVATAIAHRLRMAVWWRWIHFFFPLSIWCMSVVHISSAFYLAGFIVTLTLYWTTFKTQVPFYPSRPAVWKALLLLIQKQYAHQSVRVIDIGSGLGDTSMYLAKFRQQDQVEGIEIAPLPWMISIVRAKFNQSRAKFTMGSYEHLDFGQYDVIFAYLSPAAMMRLWEKASQEMRKGSLLVSLEFEIPNVVPTKIIHSGQHSPKMYVWCIS